MEEKNINYCACHTAQADDNTLEDEIALAMGELEYIRENCPALHSLFLPDDVWTDFKAWHSEPDRVAAHRSMLLLALQRGHLARLTGPIHRYLIESDAMRSDVRLQYVRDMRERWMLDGDPLERHRKSRRFTGRIVELQLAEWLEAQDWVIVGLEALREGPDIEARSASGTDTAFEVKSIGTEDGDFEITLRSLAEGPTGGPFSPYVAINYLLFRAYEAAKQLARFDGYRIAVVVIDEVTWWRFDFQLKNSWIDWSNPSFLNNDPAWETFLVEQESRYPQIRTELPAVIKAVDAIWIMKRSYGYGYRLEYEIQTRSI
jgi:hypothetical protein